MAAYKILTWSPSANRTQGVDSDTGNFDFNTVRIGPSQITISEADATHLNMGGVALTNVNPPTADNEVATKIYVDAVATGLTPKASVHAATTAALPSATYNNGTNGEGATLIATANGALPAQDGYTLSAGERLLVKNQAAGLQNGIYIVSALGDGSNPFTLTRASDADTCQPAANPKVISGMHMFVQNGTTLGGQGWVLVTPDPITLGTTALTFTQFSDTAASYVAGDGIDITGLTISVLADGGTLSVSGSGVKVADNGITATQLNTSVAGNGLTGGGGTALAVVADGSTLSVSGSGVKVADNGITSTQLNTSVAGNGLTGGGGSALAVQAADSTITSASGGVSVNKATTLQNDSGSTVTAGQIVHIKANGFFTLASKAVTTNEFALGIVQAASIANTASGAVVTTQGFTQSGFSGLTPGAPVYLSGTAGGVTQSTAGFTTGEFLYRVGHALSATTIVFDPEFILEW